MIGFEAPQRELKAMHRRIAKVMILTGSTCFAAVWASAEAGDWMFHRSYYSHDSAEDGPFTSYGSGGAYGSRGSAGTGEMDYSSPSRSVYREPWVGAHPHSAVRSGWRYNSFILHNGSSTDTTIFRENWYDKDY
jgi:hypothetical protein